MGFSGQNSTLSALSLQQGSLQRNETHILIFLCDPQEERDTGVFEQGRFGEQYEVLAAPNIRQQRKRTAYTPEEQLHCILTALEGSQTQVLPQENITVCCTERAGEDWHRHS